jgi:diguanylate cyclase (GGDEF)-like protein/PAS domain S-box-containing protein
LGNTPVRLLVVDDDEDDFVLVRDLLQETPGTRFSVEWAASPGEGARRLRERAHDAYLIDYRLGATSGIELMRAAIAAGVTAPIVLLTGRGDHEVDHEAMHAGAADYLVKGKFDGHQLSRVLRYAIERARDRMALELGEARYRRLFESVPAPMWVYQRDTLRFLAVNDAAIEHYGYSRDAFLAMSAADIRPAEDVSEFREFSQGLDAGMTHSGYWRHQRKDGSLIDVEISSHDIEWNGQRARMVLAKDVTEQLRAQEEIRARAAQLRQVLSDASDALIVVGADATVRFANPAVREVLGRDPDAMLGTIFDLPGLTRGEREIEVARVADEVRIAEARVSETEWEGEHARIYALRDVTDRRRAEDRTRLLERAIESTSNGVVIADARRPDLPLIYVNRAFERMTGYSAEEALGKNCRFLQGPDTSQPELGQIRAALREQRDCEVVLRNYTRQGGLLWNQLSIAPVRDSHGEVTHYIGVLNDVTERRRYEAELSYLASHDPVTGLSRYVVLQEQVEALIGARDESGKLALLYVDIDRFHTVNETMGHVIGDQALRVFAERLRESVGDPDRVCRLASDEFLALVPFDGDAGEPAAVAHCIRAALETPIEIGPYRLYLTCSIGISVYPDNGASATDLLHAAEAAMARAKRQGRDSVCSFSNEQATDLRDRLNLGCARRSWRARWCCITSRRSARCRAR